MNDKVPVNVIFCLSFLSYFSDSLECIHYLLSPYLGDSNPVLYLPPPAFSGLSL